MNDICTFFPSAATDDEKSANWRKIAEISDRDFGFNHPKAKTDITRFCVRVLLVNEENKICVIKSSKYGYMQLPGGGIEQGESIVKALKRETEEETGWLIDNIKPLGYTLEEREDIRNTKPYGKDISYVFTATPSKQVDIKYMADEIAEGFSPIWIKLSDFIAEQKQNEDNGKIKSYSGCFSNRRDLLIATFFQSTAEEQSSY